PAEGRHRSFRSQHRVAEARAVGDPRVNAPAARGARRRQRAGAELAGLDLLSSAVVVLDDCGDTAYMNPAAEQLFEVSLPIAAGQPFARLFSNPAAIERLLAEARVRSFEEKRTELMLERPMREPMQ